MDNDNVEKKDILKEQNPPLTGLPRYTPNASGFGLRDNQGNATGNTWYNIETPTPSAEDQTARIGDYVLQKGTPVVVPNSPTDLSQKYKIAIGGSGLSSQQAVAQSVDMPSIAGGAAGGAAIGSMFGPAGALIGGLAGALNTYNTNAEDALKKWQEENIKYDTAVEFYRDDTGKLNYKLDYSKMGTGGPRSGEGIKEAQTRETQVSLGDDGRLKVTVSPIFASTARFQELVNWISENYAGLTKDTENYEQIIEEIKNGIDGEAQSYVTNMKLYADYANRFPEASPDAIVAAYMTEAAGYVDPKKMGEFSMSIIGGSGIDTTTAKDFFDSVLAMDKDGRNNLLSRLNEIVYGEDSDYGDNEKAVAYGELKALYAVSRNSEGYEDDKYQGMLDADFFVTLVSSFSPLGLNAGDVLNFVSGGNLIKTKQEFLNQNDFARFVGTVGSVGGGLGLWKGATSLIEKGMKLLPGTSQLFNASLEGQTGGALAVIAQNTGDSASVLKASAASAAFKTMKVGIFDAALAGTKTAVSDANFWEEFGQDFARDAILESVFSYYDMVQFEKAVNDSTVLVVRDPKTGNLERLPVTESQEVVDEGLDVAGAYNIQKTRYGEEVGIAQSEAGTVYYYNGTAVMVSPAGETQKLLATPEGMTDGIPALNTGVAESAEVVTDELSNIERMLERAGLPKDAEVFELPSVSAASAEVAGKMAKLDTTKAMLKINENFFNKNAYLDTVNEIALAKTGDRTAWQNRSEKFVSVLDNANQEIDLMSSGAYLKASKEAFDNYTKTLGELNLAQRYTKTDANYLKAITQLERAAYLDRHKVEGDTRNYTAEALEKYGDAIVKVPEDRAEVLKAFNQVRKARHDATKASAKKSGKIDSKKLDSFTDSDLQKEIGWVPQWGKRQTYNGLLDQFYGISQERNIYKAWLPEGGWVDLDALEDPIEADRRFLDFVATNMGINDMKEATAEAMSDAGLLVDNTPSSETIRKRKLESIKNRDELKKKFSDMVAEKKKEIKEKVPNQKQYKELMQKNIEESGVLEAIEDIVSGVERYSGYVNGNEYAKDVTPDKRMNTEGYKKFKEDHLERVSQTELSPEIEDFITHIIRPGGDVDIYNSYLRDGTYKDKKDWATNYIDDFEDRYADEIEDIAFQFFQSDAEKIAKKFEVDFNKKGYWETMIKYQGALKDMLAGKMLEGLSGNYRLEDNGIFYRGVNTGGTKLNPAGDFSWMKEGEKFEDKGFGFISLSDAAARHYADGGTGEKIILEYRVPKGQRLFYFGDIDKGGNDGGAFVLPADITGTVGEITTDADGVKHVEIYIGNAPKTEKEDIWGEVIGTSGDLLDKLNEYNKLFSYDFDIESYMNTEYLPNLKEALNAKDMGLAATIVNQATLDVAPYRSQSSLLKSAQESVAEEWRDWAEKHIKAGRASNKELKKFAEDNDLKLPNDKRPLPSKIKHALGEILESGKKLPRIEGLDTGKIAKDIPKEEFYKMLDETPLFQSATKDKKELVDLVAAEINGETLDSYEMGAAETAVGLGGKYPIPWYRNGKPYTRFMKYDTKENQMLAEGIYKLFTDKQLIKQPGVISRTAAILANNFRQLTTALDPTRAPLNFARDAGRGQITSAGQSYINPGNLFKSLLEMGDYSDKQKATLSQALDDVAKLVAGETYNAAYRNPRKASIQATKQYLSQTGANPLRRFTYNLAHDKMSILEAPADFFEGLTRKRLAKSAAVVKLRQLQKEGASFEEQLKGMTDAAFFAGREYTANFARKGKLIEATSKYVAYQSSAYAGLDSMKRAFINNPEGVSKNFAVFLIAYLILLADTLGDEESRKNYYRLSDYDRGNSIVISLSDNTVLTIPLDQEVAGFLFPYRRFMETLNGVDQVSFFEFVWGTLTEPLPMDLSGFTEGEGFNLTRGLEKLLSQNMPSGAAPIQEAATGYDLYYGTDIRVTDETLKDYGIYSPEAGDYTTTSKNSATLRQVANWTGIPQWQLQSMVSGYGGNVGSYILNILDKLSGATEDAQGGKDFANAVFKSFVATDQDAAANEFYSGIQQLKQEKNKLIQTIANYNEDLKTASGDAKVEIQNKIWKAKDDYATKVGDFVDKYVSAYEITGGLSKSQAMQVYYLFRLDDDDTVYESGSVEEYYNNKAVQKFKNQATAMSAPILDKYYNNRIGNIYQDAEGNWRRYLSSGVQTMRNSIYGQSEEHMVNLLNILEGKDSEMTTLRKQVKEARNQAYNSGDWTTRDKLGYDFDTKVVEAISPYIEKYGAANVLGNNEVLDYLSDWFFVPDSFKKTKRGKNVSLANSGSTEEAFVRPYIKYVFGLPTNYYTYSETSLTSPSLGDVGR